MHHEHQISCYCSVKLNTKSVMSLIQSSVFSMSFDGNNARQQITSSPQALSFYPWVKSKNAMNQSCLKLVKAIEYNMEVFNMDN